MGCCPAGSIPRVRPPEETFACCAGITYTWLAQERQGTLPGAPGALVVLLVLEVVPPEPAGHRPLEMPKRFFVVEMMPIRMGLTVDKHSDQSGTAIAEV